MSRENKIKTIAISTETFDKLSEDALNHIKESILSRFNKADDVEFIVLPREEIFARYVENKESANDPVIILLDDKDEKEQFEKGQEELINKAVEFKIPPHHCDVIDADYIYKEQISTQKPYVPHTIGKPDSKKKGNAMRLMTPIIKKKGGR